MRGDQLIIHIMRMRSRITRNAVNPVFPPIDEIAWQDRDIFAIKPFTVKRVGRSVRAA